MSDILGSVQDAFQQAIITVKDTSVRAPGSLTTQALVVGALVGALAYTLMKKRYRLPPGPRRLPLLGNMLHLLDSEAFYIKLDRWAKENYGAVISFYFGPKLCIVLNDLESINEALVVKGADFSGRPNLFSTDTFSEGRQDIGFADLTPTWKLQRKIALQAIRHYMTGLHLEKVVHDITADVGDQMAAEPEPFDPHTYTTLLIFHMMDYICFGESKPYNDPTMKYFIEMFEKLNKESGNGFFEDIIPLLRYWPTKKFRSTIMAFAPFLDYIQSHIEKHRQTFSSDHLRDITDSILLAQMEAAREESAEVMATFTDVHVRQTISDLFGAGVDTSRFTLDWALLLMAGYPQIQKRAQAEIDAVTGSRMPGAGDRHQLQFTQAVLYETLRLTTVAPTALPHKTMCDTSVGGYEVPKDTMVIVNLWAVLHHPKVWDQPDTFKPERFLDDQGELQTEDVRTRMVTVLGGSAGLSGESVAKPELLLILACLLKRFTISLAEGQEFDLSHQPASMFVHIPKTYKIVVTPR